MTLANRVLPYAAPDLRPPQPFREDGDEPRVVPVPVTGNLGDTVVEVVRAELGTVAEGNVAVIVPDSLVAEVSAAFEAHDVAVGGPTRHGLDQQITVVPVRLVKGSKSTPRWSWNRPGSWPRNSRVCDPSTWLSPGPRSG